MDTNLLPVRPFSPSQDNSRLLSLYSAVAAADQERMDIDEQALLAQSGSPELDRWVVDAPDSSALLVASALIRLNPGKAIADASIIIHPAYRHLGLESVLIPKLTDRACQLNTVSLHIMVNSKHTQLTDFISGYGFNPQGAYTELRLAGSVVIPPVIWPFGYTLRPYSQVQDLSILTQAMNLSYIPLWGHREVSENEMASWLPDFNPDGLFLVFSEKGRAVGISRVEPSEDRSTKNALPTGYIDAPGIVPQHRRLDLYRALLLTGVNWLRKLGYNLIEMESWGDKLEVLKMYRELGFTDIRRLTSYEYRLDKST